ncbi:DUF424 family protein [Candidatus Micrarchaeota archaeon]|nr:DUF424 family protein [Candidatus Micrarchaeota archaeon]
MYLKIHETQTGRIVAICDKELIGKVLDDGTVYMDLDRHRAFYIGERAGDDDVKSALKEFDSANLVGSRCVSIAISMDIIDKEEIMYINKIPYVQIYRL